MLAFVPNYYGFEQADQLLLDKPGLVIGPISVEDVLRMTVKVGAQYFGNRTFFCGWNHCPL